LQAHPNEATKIRVKGSHRLYFVEQEHNTRLLLFSSSILQKDFF
jgi:hypothetical protein